MKSIEEIQDNLENKIVLIRLDLNVPLSNGKIIDTHRIDKIIPTLRFLREKKAKLIIISHVGRPNGKIVNDLSLKPISENLSSQLKESVKLIKNNIFDLHKENIFNSSNEKIAMLENIRFYKQEEENDDTFAKKLSILGDIYVNEAFSCSHRNHASLCKISKHTKVFSGILLKNEVEALNKIINQIERPVSCIIGGSKISTKINIIENIIPKFNNIIIVGGMANNFLKNSGYNIGKSIFESNFEVTVNKIIELAKKNNCHLILPSDVAVGKSLDDEARYKKNNEIENDDIILDIGKDTLDTIKSIISSSKSILWNGPAGYIENKNFARGSFEIAKQISEKTEEKKIFSVIGGGDTVSIINKLNLFNTFNFVSTAGGAFLEFLEGKELPGIKALN